MAAVRPRPTPPATRLSWPDGVSAVPLPPKHLLSLRIDADVLAWFRAQGPGYQTRMNAALRAYAEHTRGRDREGEGG